MKVYLGLKGYRIDILFSKYRIIFTFVDISMAKTHVNICMW